VTYVNTHNLLDTHSLVVYHAFEDRVNTMSNDDINYSEELGEIITNALEEKGMTINDLATEMGVVYEHARRWTKGFPVSKRLLKELCSVLGLDYKETEKVTTQALAVKKFGPAILEAQGIDPEMAPVQRVWKQLEDSQKKDIMALMKSMVKNGREGVTA